jgi:rhodanese-related sulfurtransferase
MARRKPIDAWRAAQNGAVLVDVRPDEHRRSQCLNPAAVQHPLPVLLWRLDPDVPTHNLTLPLDTHLALSCREGYSSSLAAAQLQAIGFSEATDVVGGVDAWLAAGLPILPCEPVYG